MGLIKEMQQQEEMAAERARQEADAAKASYADLLSQAAGGDHEDITNPDSCRELVRLAGLLGYSAERIQSDFRAVGEAFRLLSRKDDIEAAATAYRHAEQARFENGLDITVALRKIDARNQMRERWKGISFSAGSDEALEAALAAARSRHPALQEAERDAALRKHDAEHAEDRLAALKASHPEVINDDALRAARAAAGKFE